MEPTTSFIIDSESTIPPPSSPIVNNDLKSQGRQIREEYWRLYATQLYRPFSKYTQSSGVNLNHLLVTNRFVDIACQFELEYERNRHAIQFIREQIMLCFMIHEEELARREHSNIFTEEKYQNLKLLLLDKEGKNNNDDDNNITSTIALKLFSLYDVIHFVAFIMGSTRHFIYPSRLTYKVSDGLARWLRRLEQNGNMWLLFRMFLFGASGLSSILGSNEKWDQSLPPELRKTPEVTLSVAIGLSDPSSFPPHVQKAMRHGSKLEDLGRQIYCHLTQSKVIEIGTAMSHVNPSYSHSPDGIVLSDSTLSWKHDLPMDDPIDEVIFTRERVGGGGGGGGRDMKSVDSLFSKAKGVEGIIEIKCQYLKHSCYDACPEGYLPQCLQGMLVHGAKWCDFVSLYYVPERGDEDHVKITIERLHYSETAMRWMQTCLDEFSNANAKHDPDLSQRFYQHFSERRVINPDIGKLNDHRLCSDLKREYIYVFNGGIRVLSKSIRMPLVEALGGNTELAKIWKEKMLNK